MHPSLVDNDFLERRTLSHTESTASASLLVKRNTVHLQRGSRSQAGRQAPRLETESIEKRRDTDEEKGPTTYKLKKLNDGSTKTALGEIRCAFHEENDGSTRDEVLHTLLGHIRFCILFSIEIFSLGWLSNEIRIERKTKRR